MKIFSVFLAVMLMVALSSIAPARGAPTKEKAFTDHAIVSVHVAPSVANVPPMTTGYDVISIITTAPHVANVTPFAADTSAMKEQGTTGDERSFRSGSYSARSAPSPRLVMLA